MKKYRIIIAGSRSFKNYEFLKKKLEPLISSFCKDEIEIVSGCADGADSLGERFAEEYGFPVKKFPALWDVFGVTAGHARNAQMSVYGTHLVLFWDGESSGSKNMLQNAKEEGLKIKIFYFYKEEKERWDTRR